MKGKIIYVDFSRKHKTTFIMFILYRLANIMINKFKSVHNNTKNIKHTPDNVKQLFN